MVESDTSDDKLSETPKTCTKYDENLGVNINSLELYENMKDDMDDFK